MVGVGARAALVERFPAAVLRDFGAAAITPGLVNCHTHLELTIMRGFLEPEGANFFAWLKKLTETKQERMTPEDFYVSAAWGAVEAARAGITCVGDASDIGGASQRALRDVGLRGTIYQEVFGPDPRVAAEQFVKLRDKVAALRANEDGLVRAGVSPHAPYTVSPALLQLVTDYALAEDLPVMTHAAESAAEAAFMLEGRGPFAERHAARGIEWRAPGVSTIQYLAALGVLERARPLLAHCVTADEQDIRTIKATGARVAHCPKSNAKFGHGRAPFGEFLRHGLAVGFGSDSVASNNTCDILEEARFAALLSRAAGDTVDNAGRMVSADDALRTATLGGAEALGLETQIGALAEGSQADLAIISLERAHQLPPHDPATALIFASSGRDVLLTMVAGQEIYYAGRITTLDEEDLRARFLETHKRLKAVTSDR